MILTSAFRGFFVLGLADAAQSNDRKNDSSADSESGEDVFAVEDAGWLAVYIEEVVEETALEAVESIGAPAAVRNAGVADARGVFEVA